MRLYLTDQTAKLHQHLEAMKRLPVVSYDLTKLPEQQTTISIDTDKDFSELNKAVLFNYQIFPPHIMTALAQWQVENRKMRVGDTIVQQVFIPPFRRLSQKIVFGVRISKIIDEPARVGFAYETLQGHVEKGSSTFTLEKSEGGNTIFRIHTFSTPGNMLAKLVGPVFSIPYQAFCARAALKHVKRQLEAH